MSPTADVQIDIKIRLLPDWHTWVDRVQAIPGHALWPCPLADCEAVLPSAAYAAEHLVDWHGWTETEIAAWWGR